MILLCNTFGLLEIKDLMKIKSPVKIDSQAINCWDGPLARIKIAASIKSS